MISVLHSQKDRKDAAHETVTSVKVTYDGINDYIEKRNRKAYNSPG